MVVIFYSLGYLTPVQILWYVASVFCYISLFYIKKGLILDDKKNYWDNLFNIYLKEIKLIDLIDNDYIKKIQNKNIFLFKEDIYKNQLSNFLKNGRLPKLTSIYFGAENVLNELKCAQADAKKASNRLAFCISAIHNLTDRDIKE